MGDFRLACKIEKFYLRIVTLVICSSSQNNLESFKYLCEKLNVTLIRCGSYCTAKLCSAVRITMVSLKVHLEGYMLMII